MVLNGVKFHKRCATCLNCSGQLAMGQIYPGVTGEILCKVCHDKSVEHRPGPDVGVDSIKAESDQENLMTDSCKITLFMLINFFEGVN